MSAPPYRHNLSAGTSCNNLLGHGGRNLSVGVEDHGVVSATLGLGTQVTNVAEHLGQRNQSLDSLDAGAVFHGVDLATTGVDVTDNFVHVLFRSNDLNGHHLLEQYRLSLLNSFLHSLLTSNLEGHFRGVNFVVSTIEQGC